MHRFNIFNQLHKGLKALLYDTALLMQQTDLTDATEASFIVQRLEEAVHLFKHHSRQENKYILSLIFEYEPAIWDAFQKEQQKDSLLIQSLESAITSFELMQTPFDRSFAGKRMQQCFIEFVIFNLDHMAKEELLLNEILWRYYSDEVLLSAHVQLMQQSSAEENLQHQKWILKGIQSSELTTWLEIAQTSMPEAYYHALLQLVQRESSLLHTHPASIIQEDMI